MWDNKGDGAVAKGMTELPKGKDDGASRTTSKTEPQPARTRDIKCFRCLAT